MEHCSHGNRTLAQPWHLPIIQTVQLSQIYHGGERMLETVVVCGSSDEGDRMRGDEKSDGVVEFAV